MQYKFRNIVTCNKKYYFAPVITAGIMAYVSSRYLFVGSVLSLIPWGIVALLWGFISRTKYDATYTGLSYGFSQAFIFLWIDQKGGINKAQFIVLVVIITVLAVVAALCAAIAARLSFGFKCRRQR